jgi:hypothetical protein
MSPALKVRRRKCNIVEERQPLIATAMQAKSTRINRPLDKSRFEDGRGKSGSWGAALRRRARSDRGRYARRSWSAITSVGSWQRKEKMPGRFAEGPRQPRLYPARLRSERARKLCGDANRQNLLRVCKYNFFTSGLVEQALKPRDFFVTGFVSTNPQTR